MTETIIRVENLSKRYRIDIGEKESASAREIVTNLARAPFRYLERMGRSPSEQEILWALQNVSFEVKQGEVVGIVGRNGSGKSTLLKILSRITEPTGGTATLWGRVGSMLEVSAGFHPELTGRENIYLKGAMLGMKRREINRKFDSIVAFSEIEKFLDTPVKRYSSGMSVRLAFSVAAYLEPEIIIVDEVLAVGDQAFRKKCEDRMRTLADSGTTILLVSHNMGQILSLCPRSLWLDEGRLANDDNSETVVVQYLEKHRVATDFSTVVTSWDGTIDIQNVRFLNASQQPVNSFHTGESMTIEVRYLAHCPVVRPQFWVGIVGHVGHLFGANMALDGHCPEILEGEGTLRLEFHQLPLIPNQQYSVLLGAVHSDGYTILIPRTEVGHFAIVTRLQSIGLHSPVADIRSRQAPSVLVPYRWHMPDGQVIDVPFVPEHRAVNALT